MESWDLFRALDNLRSEVDEVFRSAGYIRPAGANYMTPTTTRRFPLSTFNGDERKIFLSLA